MANDNPFSTLTSAVKEATQATQVALEQRGIQVSQVDLELKTTLTKSGGTEIGFKIEIIPIDISVGGNLSHSDVQIISLSLVPSARGMEFESELSDELVAAVRAVTDAVDDALQSKPAFDLNKATIELSFGVTKDGKAKFSIFSGAEGKINSDAVQKIKLKLKGPAAKPDKESGE
jgi:hypothetical protein